MKIVFCLLTLLLIYSAGFTQNVIEPKYKNPALGNKNSSTAVKLDLNKDLIIKVYGESKSDKIFDKLKSEYNSFNQNGDEVWIYADEFFNGEKKVLKVGDYTLVASAKSKELGTNWNDKISSMLIPTSLKVTFFMDDKFAGLSTETSGFGVKNMESGATGFRGDYYTFNSPGKHTKGGIYFVDTKSVAGVICVNDQISSLKIYK